MADGPEKKVKLRIRRGLERIGAVRFCPATHGYGASGVSDEVACLNGWFIAIEVKAKQPKPTRLQDRFLRAVSKNGGLAFCAAADSFIAYHEGEPWPEAYRPPEDMIALIERIAKGDTP